jgi:hypothetical protein
MWRHPDRAMHRERTSFLGKVLRSVLVSLVAAAVVAPAKHLLQQLEPSARPR